MLFGPQGNFIAKILLEARVEAKLISTHPGSCLSHNAAEPLDDISGGTLSDDTQLPLEPQKNLSQ